VAAAASLGAGGAAASSGGGGAPLEPRLSWWQRVVGAKHQQQSQQQSDVFGRQLAAQHEALSPRPSWYHRISAPQPLKGGARKPAGPAGLASPPRCAVNAAGAPPSVGGHSSRAARLALGLPKQRRPFVRQVGVLFWRGMLDMLRNPLLTAFHALGGLVLGLLVGIIFFSVKNDTSGAQNRVGAIFFALCLLAFTSVTSVDLVQVGCLPVQCVVLWLPATRAAGVVPHAHGRLCCNDTAASVL
jgi:hypothetical protein